MWLRKIVLFTSFILFGGCAIKDNKTDEQTLGMTQRISTNNGLISIMAPLHKNIGPFYTVYRNSEGMGIFWGIQNMMVCKLLISTEAVAIHTFDSAKYLNAKNLKFFEEEIKTKESFYNESFGLTYKKGFLDYIDGVKCRTFIEKTLSQVYPHTINGEKTYTQYYETYCSFHEATNREKPTNMIRMRYEYSFNKNSKAFTDTNKTKQEVLNDIENTFRQDMQAIFSTIKLGMDREKMKKEGLLFDKPYKVQF
ncbi:hypothetical protein LMG7974_01904 [Campylobacter majalis]|uniref:Lipoprotein n=1 Tax=Campylobacter majalis TaxID=2790656 RepID=A0ABM8Q9Z9_9BACT|nr:hypothetical protein [Campylobacter majalis]CAD7289821.1 hypothetical protein LMG7974_01904 [Campylobacter majalis]